MYVGRFETADSKREDFSVKFNGQIGSFSALIEAGSALKQNNFRTDRYSCNKDLDIDNSHDL